MKKQIIALAVAAAVSAPAMADITLYGAVAVDFINKDTKTVDSSQIQRDDVIFGMKAASETDGGLMVGGEIKTEGDFSAPTLAYVNVGTEMATLWAGKFGNPADAADAADFSDTGNATHIGGEIDNAVAVTVGAGGFTAAIGATQAARTTDKAATATAFATEASDNDSMIGALGFSAGGISANVGYVNANDTTKTVGVKVGYKADAFSVAAYNVQSEDITIAAGPVATGFYDEVNTTGVTGSMTFGATTVSVIVAQDEYKLGADKGENDVRALKVAQALGGGLTAYAEYGNIDGDVAGAQGASGSADQTTYTVGMSYSF